MQVIQPEDPRLDYVFQGVRQAHDGQCYREGRFKDGGVAYVDATDPRKFTISDGNFSDGTKHALVDGRRCDSAQALA